MTQGQRRTHLWAWLVLGPLLIVAILFAVVLRPAPPIHEGQAPGSLPDPAQDGAQVTGGQP